MLFQGLEQGSEEPSSPGWVNPGPFQPPRHRGQLTCPTSPRSRPELPPPAEHFDLHPQRPGLRPRAGDTGSGRDGPWRWLLLAAPGGAFPALPRPLLLPDKRPPMPARRPQQGHHGQAAQARGSAGRWRPRATGVPLPRASTWGVPACAEAGAAAVPLVLCPRTRQTPQWLAQHRPRPPSAGRPGLGELLGSGARPPCLIKDSLCLQATAWFFLPRVSLGQGWGRQEAAG